MYPRIIQFVFRLAIGVLLIGLYNISGSAQIVPGEGMDSGLGGSNTLAGTVYTPAGRLSARVTIRLSTMTRGDRVGATDDRGNFIFRGLPSGTYTIIIDKEKDFEPFAQNVEIIQLRGSPPQTYNISIRLTPKANTLPKPSVFDAALATLPERGKALFTKAQELEKAGDQSGAIDQLIMLTTEFPNFMMGFNELAVAYMKMGQFDKSETALQTAQKLEPEAFAPMLNHGLLLVTMKRWAEAETVLLTAKKQNAQSGPVRYLLGQAQANLGKFDEAEKELSAAVTMGGKEMIEAHRILAIIYNSRGDRKRAVTELETYLNGNPATPDAEQLKKVLDQWKAAPAQPAAAVQKPAN